MRGRGRGGDTFVVIAIPRRFVALPVISCPPAFCVPPHCFVSLPVVLCPPLCCFSPPHCFVVPAIHPGASGSQARGGGRSVIVVVVIHISSLKYYLKPLLVNENEISKKKLTCGPRDVTDVSWAFLRSARTFVIILCPLVIVVVVVSN
jgi:hypothetical protein